MEQRSHLLVETVLCEHPRLVMHHIPLLLSGIAIFEAADTVFTWSPMTKINPRTLLDEQCVERWLHSARFRQLLDAVGPGVAIVGWSIFVDKTRLVKYGNRKGHVVLACPLNNPRGRFDIVGFIPEIAEEEARAAGLTSPKTVTLLKLHILHQALHVVLLYGGLRGDSPSFLVKVAQGEPIPARNVLGNVRVDGEELCAVTGRVIVTSDRIAKDCSCYRHHMPSAKLSEPVLDSDVAHGFYSHGGQYYANLQRLLDALDDPAHHKKDVLAHFRRLGLYPIMPALARAWCFDSAKDVLGDIQHVGPHGIGLLLLQFLPKALHLVFPDRDAEGEMIVDYVGAGVELHQGEAVTLPLNVPAGAPPRRDGLTLVVTSTGAVHAVPSDAVKVTVAHDAALTASLAELDSGVRALGVVNLH